MSACEHVSRRGKHFGIICSVLCNAVRHFDSCLSGVTAREYVVKLMVYYGKCGAESLHLGKELGECTELNSRIERERSVVDYCVDVASCRSAAVVAYAVNIEERVDSVFPAEERNVVKAALSYAVAVEMRVAEHENFLAGLCSPEVNVLLSFISAAVIVVIYSAVLTNFGSCQVVSEGVGLKVDSKAVGVDIEQL